jgi:pimeloyl-ACP methyl ester carboxylesterase
MYRLLAAAFAAATLATTTPSVAAADVVHYRTVAVDGQRIFYRESGPAGGPTILLLHGFPTSSHMFRTLIPDLAVRYHVIAPDMPGFGFSSVPDPHHFRYSFAHLAAVMDDFTRAVHLDRFAIYVFDYGAPVGYRIAMRHPERITAIVSQNGNAYREGLGTAWGPIQRYWKSPTAANRAALRSFLLLDVTKFQYVSGVTDVTVIAPESYMLDQALLERPGEINAQLDLFGDYRNNVALYPAFHAYFRAYHPPLLAVWGAHDPFFTPAGARAYRNDIPDAEVHFYDTGHFALETHEPQIAQAILAFLDRVSMR